jgi:hypothetical protein
MSATGGTAMHHMTECSSNPAAIMCRTFLFGRELDNPCRPWQPPVQSSPSPGFVSHQGSWPDALQAGGDPGTHGPRCTLSELLGFCRFVLVPDETPNSNGSSWGPVGAPGPSPLASLLVSSALADLILWGVLRAYAKLAASQAYQEVSMVGTFGIVMCHVTQRCPCERTLKNVPLTLA